MKNVLDTTSVTFARAKFVGPVSVPDLPPRPGIVVALRPDQFGKWVPIYAWHARNMHGETLHHERRICWQETWGGRVRFAYRGTRKPPETTGSLLKRIDAQRFDDGWSRHWSNPSIPWYALDLRPEDIPF